MPKPSAGNDDRAIVLATFCWTTVHSRPRRLAIRAKDPLWARWRDHDPSRIALWHGNSDFGRRAWRDHAELPDSVAELPFGCRGGLVARRFRCSRSGLDRTACRQGPESGSEHTETSCKTLHRQSETHQPPSPAQIPAGLQPRSDQACRRARASQGQALRVAAKMRPALTGPARGGCAIWRSGRKNARGAGRTKEWIQQNRKTPSIEIVDFCCAQTRRHLLHGF
jgi:hypothetical protein